MPFEYKRHSQPAPHLPKTASKPTPKPAAGPSQPEINPLAAYQSSLNRAAVASPPGGRTRSGRAKPAKPIPQPGQLKRRVKRVTLVVLGLLVAGGLWWFFTAGHGKFSLANLFGAAVKTAIGHKDTVAGESRGRTNILVYGMTKDGYRTDTIMLVSYYWQQKKVVTLNIPRDLYAYDGYENAKMGEIYAYAKQRQPKDPNYPDQFVANVVSKEYNQPIDYWVQFNMQGEVDFVNAIGGIDVSNPNAFTDCEYPTWDYSGFVRPCPHFDAGQQHLNGSRALTYSRSRHALQNDEGSDFARSKRQMLVIQATLTKLKSMGVVGNIAQVSHYLNILGDNLTTNMSTDDMVAFATTLKNISPQNDLVRGSWATDNGFLCDAMTSQGAYIIRYGVQGNCLVAAGGYKDSKYRQMAIWYIKNMLTSAPMQPTDFVQAAGVALGYATPTPSPVSSGNGR
jgi:LCP family protein required for cell wall assembly